MIDTPSRNLAFLSAWGTQPQTTRDFSRVREEFIRFTKEASEGSFTVQLFNTQQSALGGEGGGRENGR